MTLAPKLKIIDILESNGKKAQVVLDVCPFHPSGGGQPGDTGKLFGGGFRADVRDTRKLKQGKQEGFVLDLMIAEGKLAPGMEVFAEVDLARNALLSRMHTGQHIFSRLQENACDGLETVKVNIGESESVVYVRYDGELTWDSLFDVEEKTSLAIRENIPVEPLVMPREDAEKLPELKAHWDRIHDSEIRIVRIAGVDATACSGTHTASTQEVGGFMVTGFNGSPPDWEIRFTVRQEEISREHSRAMRKILREIGCKSDQVVDVFARQKEENEILHHVLDKVRGYISFPWEVHEATGNAPALHVAVVGGLTKELLSAPARAHAVEYPDAFCLVLAPNVTAAKEPFPFILLRGADLSTDLSSFVKNFPELEARGGGKPDWLNGMTTQKNPSVWRNCLARCAAL